MAFARSAYLRKGELPSPAQVATSNNDWPNGDAHRRSASADVRYDSVGRSGGVAFLAYLELEEGRDKPLRTLPAYAALPVNLNQWQA